MVKRYAAKIDNNQNQIVKVLRQIPGISVALNHDDILIGWQGRTYWIEIKNPEQANKAGKVFNSKKQEGQRELEKTWTGHYKIVTTVEEILKELEIFI